MFSKCKNSEFVFENDKKNKTSTYQSLSAIFVKFLTDFVDWNVENSKQGKSISLVDVSEELIAVFQMKNLSNWHRKWQKTDDFQIFKVFMQYLSHFPQTQWIGKLKRFSKVAASSPVVFRDEMSSVFWMKKIQIDTDFDKSPKIFHISNFCSFFSNYWQTTEIVKLDRVKKERSCCAVCLVES